MLTLHMCDVCAMCVCVAFVCGVTLPFPIIAHVLHASISHSITYSYSVLIHINVCVSGACAHTILSSFILHSIFFRLFFLHFIPYGLLCPSICGVTSQFSFSFHSIFLCKFSLLRLSFHSNSIRHTAQIDDLCFSAIFGYFRSILILISVHRFRNEEKKNDKLSGKRERQMRIVNFACSTHSCLDPQLFAWRQRERDEINGIIFEKRFRNTK